MIEYLSSINVPSITPTNNPTNIPSIYPSFVPSYQKSYNPTNIPTFLTKKYKYIDTDNILIISLIIFSVCFFILIINKNKKKIINNSFLNNSSLDELVEIELIDIEVEDYENISCNDTKTKFIIKN